MIGNGNGDDDEILAPITPVVPRPSASRPGPAAKETAAGFRMLGGQSANPEDPQVTLAYIGERLRYLTDEAVRRDTDADNLRIAVARIEGNQLAIANTFATLSEQARESFASAHAKFDTLDGTLALVRADLKEDIAELRVDTLELRKALARSKSERDEIARQMVAHRARMTLLERHAKDARMAPTVVKAPSPSQPDRDSKREEDLTELAKRGMAIAELQTQAKLAREKEEAADLEAEREAKRMARKKLWTLLGSIGAPLVAAISALIASRC